MVNVNGNESDPLRLAQTELNDTTKNQKTSGRNFYQRRKCVAFFLFCLFYLKTFMHKHNDKTNKLLPIEILRCLRPFFVFGHSKINSHVSNLSIYDLPWNRDTFGVTILC